MLNTNQDEEFIRQNEDTGLIETRPAQIIPVTFSKLSSVIIPGTPPGQNQPFCPARPKGNWPHTDEEITDWVRQVIVLGIRSGLLYMPTAIRYFAEHCFWTHTTTDGKTCPHHERARNLAYNVALREHAKGNIISNHFVDDAPDGI